jgi:hypothetical protein
MNISSKDMGFITRLHLPISEGRSDRPQNFVSSFSPLRQSRSKKRGRGAVMFVSTNYLIVNKETRNKILIFVNNIFPVVAK